MNHFRDSRVFKSLVGKWTGHTSDKYNEFKIYWRGSMRYGRLGTSAQQVCAERWRICEQRIYQPSGEIVGGVGRTNKWNPLFSTIVSCFEIRMYETGENVQRLFAEMAKTVPTRNCKSQEFYETKMKECETEACKDFKEKVEKWSKGLIYY